MRRTVCIQISIITTYISIYYTNLQSMKKTALVLRPSNFKPIPPVNLALTVTTPTYDLTSHKYLEELIHPFTSYQVIPSIPKSMVYDVEQTILFLLPLSRNKLIDVALPFRYQDKDHNDAQYFGRYLIFNEMLIGIRLSSFQKKQGVYPGTTIKKWPAGQTTQYTLPKSILDYYRNHQFKGKSFKKQILIGDFILSFNNVRIGLLFESQTKDIDHILHQYKRHGCEIISILCDVPRQHHFQNNLNFNNYKTSTANENVFKKFARSYERIIMYSGVRMAPLNELYLTNSFIMHSELPQKNVEPYLFNDGGSLTTVCTLPEAQKQQRRQGGIDEQGSFQLFIDESLIEVFSDQSGKTDIKQAFCSKKVQQPPLTKQLTEIFKKMNVWYLFKEVNQNNPFTIPLPLTQKTNLLVKQIRGIVKFLKVKLDDFLILFKNNKQYMANEQDESDGIYIYNDIDILLTMYPHKKFYIYTDDIFEIKHLSQLALNNQQIQLCHSLMPFQALAKQNRLLQMRYKKLDEFANQILRNRTVSFKKIIIQANNPSWKLTKDQIIEAVTKHLRVKLRTQIRQHPFYNSLLKKTCEQIQKGLEQADIELVGDNNIPINQLWENIDKNQQVLQIEDSAEKQLKDKDFWGKMKEQKKIQTQQLKKTFITCHRCLCFLEKQFVHRCKQCKVETCFVCIEPLLKQKLKERIDFVQQCVACLNLCQCVKCKRKGEKINQSGNVSTAAITEAPKQAINQQKLKQKQKQVEAEAAYKQSCTLCLIMERKSINIKIYCSKCDKNECILCIRDKEKSINFGKAWLCQDCRPAPVQSPKVTSDHNIQVTPHQSSSIGFKESNRELSESHSPVNIGSKGRKDNQPQNSNDDNRQNQFESRGRDRGRGRGSFNNNDNSRPNTFYTKQNDRKPSVSLSKSVSPVRKNNTPTPKDNNKPSPSLLASTPINKKKETKDKSRSLSRSNSPIINRNQKTQDKSKVVAQTHSQSSWVNNKKPTAVSQYVRNKSKSRSLSRSVSPPRKAAILKNNDSKNVQQTQRNDSTKRSLSRSNSPVRQKKDVKKDTKKSVSRSISRSNSPPRKVTVNKKKSSSRSRSRSNQRDKQTNNSQNNNNFKSNRSPFKNDQQKPLWGNKSSSNNNNDEREKNPYNRYQDRNNDSNNNRGRNNNYGNNGNYNNSGNSSNNYQNKPRNDNNGTKDDIPSSGRLLPVNQMEQQNDFDY